MSFGRLNVPLQSQDNALLISLPLFACGGT
uniref:Uncharacterized protein n=1 Tax=Rhizophora mucronata TaxID=61149 RepID=A0A2P2NCX0_RHIMU